MSPYRKAPPAEPLSWRTRIIRWLIAHEYTLNGIDFALTAVCILLAISLSVCTLSCKTVVDVAIVASNTARDVEVSGATMLSEECTKEYDKTDSMERIKQLDRVCLPMQDALASLRAARLQTNALIIIAQSGGNAAALPGAVQALTEAAKATADAVTVLTEK